MSEETRKAEAHGNVAEVKFRGQVFTISLEYDDWPIELTEALEEGRAVGICKHALGPKQWRRVQALGLKNRDLTALMNAITEALGFGDAGESEASSG